MLQALQLDQGNTKALFRRAQAWQGLKEHSKAMVTFTTSLKSVWRKLKYNRVFVLDISTIHINTSRYM